MIILALRTLAVIRPEQKMPCDWRSSSHLCYPQKGFFKDSLELCRCSGKVLSALAAVVISLVPIGSSASRERETGCLPGEALFICLGGFPPSRPTTVWLGTYWSLSIFPHLPKGKKMLKYQAGSHWKCEIFYQNLEQSFFLCSISAS